MKKIKINTIFTAILLFVLSIGIAVAGNDNSAEPLIDKAVITVEQMLNHPKYGKDIKLRMKNAKAVFIAPQILKGGFFIGGEAGKGILLARADNGEWSYPGFYYFAAASFGIQFGAQTSELFMIIKTGKGLNAIMKNKLKFGGDLSAAIGYIGDGIEKSTTTNLNIDIMVYSIAKGAFIGASIEGAAILPDNDLNDIYYDAKTSPKEIIIDGQHSNQQADKLRAALTKF